MSILFTLQTLRNPLLKRAMGVFAYVGDISAMFLIDICISVYFVRVADMSLLIGLSGSSCVLYNGFHTVSVHSDYAMAY